jgi:hypothetical protein
VTNDPSLDLEKVVGEIVGSAFYGAFTEFLGDREHHDLGFSSAEIEEICAGVRSHAERRLLALSGSFDRIRSLTPVLARQEGLGRLVSFLRQWFDPEVMAVIRDGVRSAGQQDFVDFLTSLKPSTDSYCQAKVDVTSLQNDLTSIATRGHP